MKTYYKILFFIASLICAFNLGLYTIIELKELVVYDNLPGVSVFRWVTQIMLLIVCSILTNTYNKDE